MRHDISIKEKAVSDYETRLRVLEENQDACENLQNINARIEQKRIEQRKLMGYINLDYNAMLLDDMWILRAFPPILSEYQKKLQPLVERRENCKRLRMKELRLKKVNKKLYKKFRN